MASPLRERLRGLKTKWAIPPWILLVLSVSEKVMNILGHASTFSWLASMFQHTKVKWPISWHLPDASLFMFLAALAWLGVLALWPRQKITQSQILGSGSVPELFLDYSAENAKDFLSKTGLTVGNCGTRPAFIVTLSCDNPRKMRLQFDHMPIQRIDPNKPVTIDLWAEHLDDDGRWLPIGGTRGAQIPGCFEWLNHFGDEEKIFVTITYRDYDGKSDARHWVILREGILFLSKHIWCQPVHAPGSET